MPSIKKQKAKQKPCVQSEIMSALDNIDVMLGNFPETVS